MPGKKYINEDIAYVSFKKHYCPSCKTKLKTVKVSKIVDYNSPEAKDYDFEVGTAGDDFVVTGKVEFVRKEFECPNCHAHFSVKELKKSEGIDVGSESTHNDTGKRNHIWNIILFCVISTAILLIIHFVKSLF